MTRNFYPYDFFTLQYISGKFFLVLVTREYFVSSSVAKARALSGFGFGNNDVPVIFDKDSNFLYFHPKQRVWYRNLNDSQLLKLFPWLVPST
jgi:hypothetical protein